MPKKRNNDLKEKYPCIRAGTLAPMCIKDILTKIRFFAIRRKRFITRVKHIMTLQVAKI